MPGVMLGIFLWRPLLNMVEAKKIGRPTVYKEEYVQQLIDYFNVEPFKEVIVNGRNGEDKIELVPNKFPTLARFACNIGVTRETIHDWATKKHEDGSLIYPEFSYSYKTAKAFQEALLVEGGISGAFNAPFSIFTAKNVLGWRDKQEHEVSGKDGEPIKIEDVSMADVAKRLVFILSAGIDEIGKTND